MAKPEWGVKRTCQSCGARFYDLKRDPIKCPGCEAVHAGDRTAKPRRTPAPVAVTPAAAVPAEIVEGADDTLKDADKIEKIKDSPDSDVEDSNTADEEDVVIDDDEGDDNLIEDDLDDDDDDDNITVVVKIADKEETI